MLMFISSEKKGKTLLRYFSVFIIIISIKLVNAQDDQVDITSSSYSEPSLFVVIGVLSFMISLTFVILMYAKICYQEPTPIHIQSRLMFGTHTRFSGLDLRVVESLPLFKFSTLKGTKQGLQCAVCLAEFEEIKILRLLPKCKHGFHIGCIDQWLEHHSTCPLCRQKVTSEDLTMITEGKPDRNELFSSFELFIEREDEGISSRFSIGGSFRRTFNVEEEIMPSQVEKCNFHRVNHQIVVSDVVFKNRWSNVSSSDLMYLNSEMLGFMSSDRISSSNLMGVKYDTGFDNSREISLISGNKRAMSEITGVSRVKHLMCGKVLRNSDDENYDEDVGEDIKRRGKWFGIAKRTVKWFANRENNRSHQLATNRLETL